MSMAWQDVGEDNAMDKGASMRAKIEAEALTAQTEVLDRMRRHFFRELLYLSDKDGYDSAYPLAPIAAELGIESGRFLYDGDTETGLLWGYGGNMGENGMLHISDDGIYASVAIETRDLLKNWAREPLSVRPDRKSGPGDSEAPKPPRVDITLSIDTPAGRVTDRFNIAADDGEGLVTSLRVLVCRWQETMVDVGKRREAVLDEGEGQDD